MMEWKAANKNDQGLLKIPKRWLHVHYYEALNMLFRFENSIRVFVYTVLKNEFSEKWTDLTFTMPGGDSQSIRGVAGKRIKQAEAFGYLGFDIQAPLMHLTSGELIELMCSDAYWPKFKVYFRGNKEIIKNKLFEIGSIRNSLAHFRPIRPEDIEVVKQNSRHTLMRIEQCLANVFTQGIRVPTNTNESWYKSLGTLGTERITTAPFYSQDESWVCLKLTFSSPILSRAQHSSSFFSFVVGKINSPNILIEYTDLRNSVTYLREAVSYPTLTKDFQIAINKELAFVFRKDVLAATHERIAKEVSSLLMRVSEECELLEKDALARGAIVETAPVSAWWHKPDEKKEGSWNYTYHALWQPYQTGHPDEYWGSVVAADDVIAATHRYPWMPEDISQMEGAFDWLED